METVYCASYGDGKTWEGFSMTQVQRDFTVTARTERGTREFWVFCETEETARSYVEDVFTNEVIGRFAHVSSVRLRKVNPGGRTNAVLFQGL